MVHVSKSQVPIIGAVVLLLLIAGITMQSTIYQLNADTLTTSGTMNIGMPKTFYLANTQLTDIPVSGDVFANATSEGVKVEINPNNKYCTYVVSRAQSGLGIPWEEYDGTTLANDIKYNVKVTQPSGAITTVNDISPFDMQNKNIQLQTNPDRPTQAVNLIINGQQAALGEGQCDSKDAFVILKWGTSTVAIKKSVYDAKMNSIWLGGLPGALNPAIVYDIQQMFNNPYSSSVFVTGSSNAMDVSQVSGYTSQVQYLEPRLGDAQVSISVPYWAFNTIIFEKVPDGKASVDSCSILTAERNQRTYAHLVYTNIGDTSKFFYSFSGDDYSMPTGSNTAIRIASGSQRTENFAVSANNVNQNAVLKIDISGESGITTSVDCKGTIVQAGSGITPPVQPSENESINGSLACQNQIPFIQKTVIQTTGGIFGTPTTTCAWDYSGIAILFFITGAALYFYGDSQNKEDMKEYGVSMAILGIIVFAGVQFYESTFLSYFGGSGILLLVGLGAIVYLLIKSAI